MAIQWHPLFAQLLRPLLDGYYEVRINVPVGDAPREADLVLLRRTGRTPLPFVGIWRHLTTWSILEYKGPTVSARLAHLDLLVELGLGVHRRLNEEYGKAKKPTVPAAEVSFWYLANRIGARFLKDAARKLHPLEPLGPGLWRGAILDRPFFLVAGADLPVETDSAPFHVLDVHSADRGLAAAQLVVHQPTLWDLYSRFVASLNPETLQELLAMGRASKKGPQFHLKPLADLIGMKEVIHQLGARAIIHQLGATAIVDELGSKKIVDELGSKKIVDELGSKRIVEAIGADRLIDEAFDHLSNDERTELKRLIHRRKK